MSKLLVDEISDADNTGPVTVTDGLTVQGAFTSLGIDDNATSTAMTIDSSGNLLVGKTSSSATTQGIEARADGRLWVSTSSDDSIFNRAGTDGGILSFRKNGTTVGSISSNSGSYIAIGSDDTGILFYDGGDAVTPFNTTTQANAGGALDLGHSDIRWRNLYLSGGVNFGSAGGTGTSTSVTLDDYEEGTFTYSLPCSVSGGYYPRAGYATGYYTKVGRIVSITLRYETLGSSSPSGQLQLSNLPFVFISTIASGSPAFGWPILIRGANNNGDFASAFFNAEPATSYGGFWKQLANGTYAVISNNDVASNFEGQMCFSYFTS